MVNAETILCFDMVPLRPGLDYVAEKGNIKVNVLIVHHGNEDLYGDLRWRWSDEDKVLENMPVKS